MSVPGTLQMAALGSGNRSLAELNVRLKEELNRACRQFESFSKIRNLYTEVSPVSDCIILKVTMEDGRQYMHPRFLTRQEVDNNMVYDNIFQKLQSTIDGTPWEPMNPQTMHKANSFSLEELEQAEELINQCKS